MGKKIRKIIGVLFTALALAVTQIPASDVEAVSDASTSDFKMDGTTLVKYNGTSENVSISNSVEKIEAEAFAGNDTIQTVTIGSSVEVIGASAFEECSQLTKVIIPDSVEVIEQAAFAGCPVLKTVEIGTGLQELGNGAFAGASSLADIKIDSSNPKFTCDDGAIYNKNGRDTLYTLLAGRKNQTYIMPSTIEKISPYAFWGDNYLEKVAISSNVADIAPYMFSNCMNLSDVQIPYSVKNIDMKAFEDCIRLRHITIPASVSSIHSTAFDGCTKLEIEAQEGSVAKTFADNLVLEDIDITEYEDTSIGAMDSGMSGDDASEEEKEPFDYYHEVTHINALEQEEDSSVKGKTKIIGNQAFVFIDNANATVNSGETQNEDATQTESTDNAGDADDADGDSDSGSNAMEDNIIGGNTEGKGTLFPKYTVIDEKLIADQAYYGDEREQIEIADTITEIGEFAFARSGITAAKIPEGVTKIGYAAFYHCDDLREVQIPETVTQIEPSAFDKTAWLENWKESGSGNFLVVGDGILLAYRGSNSVISIPAGVKKIGADALADHKGLTKVILPDSVEEIGEGAFAGCSNLTAFEGGNGLKKIKDRAFAGCPITNIVIPAQVEEIGLRAFDVKDLEAAKAGSVISFAGDTIPTVSYEESATKLYHDDYRGLALNGVQIAVVPDNMTQFDGTVFDESLQGFRGVVCTIEDTELKIQKMYRDGESLVDYPDTVSINGTEYTLNKIDVPKKEKTEEVSDTQEGKVAVRISSEAISEDAADAVLDGAQEGYVLKIVESSGAKKEISDVYKNYYGDTVPANLQGYDITLQEADTSLPITKLGRQSMEVTIPMPKGIGEENLHVVCLDNNGQLEEVKSRIEEKDKAKYIVFEANHFSDYGIYNYVSGNVAKVNNGQAFFNSLTENKDESPDTGDNSIHPKWFFGAGLLFTGLALIFYRGKRKLPA